MNIIRTIRNDWPEIKEAWRLTDKSPLYWSIILGLLLALSLTSCSSTKGVPDARANAALVGRSVGVKLNDSIAEYNNKNTPNPAPLISPGRPALLPRLADAIGLSTPAGRAKRQARKDAKAPVPRSIGKGAVYAPNNSGKILNAGNKGGQVANADSGAVVTQAAIEKNKGAAATGPGATATNTEVKAGFPWWKVGFGLGSFGLLVLLVATPAGPWLLALFKRRKEPLA